MKLLSLGALFTVLFTLSTLAGDSVLRINCTTADTGAEIYLNGKLKGECPLDLMIDAGTYTVEAIRKVDEEHEQRWSQKINLGADTVKRLTVKLSQPQLTAEAVHARKIANYNRVKAEAEAGNSTSMRELAKLYQGGTGAPLDTEEAQKWLNKAQETDDATAAQTDLKSAKKGNIAAMKSLVLRYTDGIGVEKNAALAAEWKQKAIDTTEQVRQQKIADEAKQKELDRLAQAEKEKQKIAEKQERERAQIQARINAIDFNKNMKDFVNKQHIDDDNVLEVLFTGVPCALLGGASDLIATPVNLTKKKKLEKELQAHAAAWAQPDSMIALSQTEQTEKAKTKAVLNP